MERRIELDAPNVSGLEKKYLFKCIDTSFVSTFGPFVPELEDKFAKYLGIKKAVSLQSGTAALHMALYELGITKGDEVIIPALTFVATVNPIIYVGAIPVFVDVDIKTFNISPGEIVRKITKKTKAIIPVHLYGNPCNMDGILKVAKKYGLYVIEDAAQSLGAKYKGSFTGTVGDFGCFSFNGNKVITTGGGGMIVAKDKKRTGHIKFLANQARDAVDGYSHSEVGFNYRMTNLDAALGLAQMERLKGFLAKKKLFNRIYRKELEGTKGIIFQEEEQGAESSFWLNTICFRHQMNIPALQEELKEKKIPTRRVYMPVPEFAPYHRFKHGSLKNSYYIYANGLSLPGSTLNSGEDIVYVCKIIKKVLTKHEIKPVY